MWKRRFYLTDGNILMKFNLTDAKLLRFSAEAVGFIDGRHFFQYFTLTDAKILGSSVEAVGFIDGQHLFQ